MQKRKLKVLLVEDNPGDARLLQEMLLEADGAPFELERADRLSAGLERLSAGGIDLVLLDLSLPDSHGIETFATTQAHAPQVPLIVLSGLSDESLAVKTVQEGAQDYLVKGHVDSLLLVRSMRYAIERKRTQEQLALYTEELRKKNAQMEADLSMARQLQQAFLPQQYPSFPRAADPRQSALRFCHRYHPTATVSGDFFDVLALSETQAGVFVCDVMGHGVRSALITAMVRALVEQRTSGEPCRAEDPGQFLTAINSHLLSILEQAQTPLFLSAVYLVADVLTGQLLYANAGHPSPLHVRRDAGVVERLGMVDGGPGAGAGPALGMFPDAVYPTSRTSIAANDLLMLFTDGLYEVEGVEGEYGEERLLAAVRRRIALPAPQLFDELLAEIQRFSGSREFEDDVCLVGMEVARTGPECENSSPG